MYLFHMHILRNSTESTLNLCESKYSSLLVYVKTTMFSQGRNMLVFMMFRHFQSDSFFYCSERPKRNTNIISYTRDHRLLLYCTLAILLWISKNTKFVPFCLILPIYQFSSWFIVHIYICTEEWPILPTV